MRHIDSWNDSWYYRTMSHKQKTRHLDRALSGEPSFRLRQAEEALFRPKWRSWADASTLSAMLRERLSSESPWMTIEPVAVLASRRGDTYKAVVRAADGARFETVLMRNARGHWSVCVSSQVGCAMGCTFCATGRMGLTRDLSADEIVDQYRFWTYFLADRDGDSGTSGGDTEAARRITNIVFMGMGEPLANYENVRSAIRVILDHTDLGPTRIVVSTVGLIPMLDRLLKDPLWPPVRLAVSLHSADAETRKRIMPTSYDTFLERLADWTDRYFSAFESRRRHVTFEYILLEGVNDSEAAARKLARFANRIGHVRINLIPYNATANAYRRSGAEPISRFQAILESRGVTVTRRRTMGDDIAAACGQLVTENMSSGV